MISIQRPPEPAALRAQRAQRLPEFRDSAVKDPELITGYQCARPVLFTAQHHKCCYCEKATEEKHNHVEHYRPKSLYWWLAWTWDNLLYSCEICNEHKGERFPLKGGIPLRAEEAPPGTEDPLFLDPSDPKVNPRLHIQFRLYMNRWTAFPRDGSQSGAKAIDLCALNRPDLLEFRTHYADAMQPSLNALNRAFAVQDRENVQATWTDLIVSFTAPNQPFTALALDILDAAIPSAERDRYGLSLPSPGCA